MSLFSSLFFWVIFCTYLDTIFKCEEKERKGGREQGRQSRERDRERRRRERRREERKERQKERKVQSTSGKQTPTRAAISCLGLGWVPSCY